MKNRALIVFITLCFLIFDCLQALSSKYPVDISFLVADLKYSEEKGVKICEIQHGILSTFKGDRESYGEPGNVAPHFVKILSQVPGSHWVNPLNLADEVMRSLIKEKKWNLISDYSDLVSNSTFKSVARKKPLDPSDISTYHALVYVNQNAFENLDAFRLKFPGVIVLDAAASNYWVDKNKMSRLFLKNSELSKIKPRWNLYKKKYSEDLALNIIKDLDAERFVIKPKGQFKGNGVIIVDKENLNHMLKYIIQKPKSLKKDPEDCIKYWADDHSDSFIVEEFVSSDPVYVGHLKGIYEPTIRVAFVLIYNNHLVQLEFCGAYLRLPAKSIDEPGTLNEKFKDAVAAPFYAKIPPEMYDKIKAELSIALPILYEQMLQD